MDASKPVGINPKGALKAGHSIDGVLPDDQRRGGGFTWPPPKENYVWEALQGALAQAVILQRAGYDPFNWQDQALLRAVRWLHAECEFPAAGDDSWQLHVINHFYGTSFPAPMPAEPGKNVGWTDWTLASRRWRLGHRCDACALPDATTKRRSTRGPRHGIPSSTAFSRRSGSSPWAMPQCAADRGRAR